jgi:hypothetical protein
MNKKAQDSHPTQSGWNTILGLVLGIVVILVFIGFPSALYGMFSSSNVDSSSLAGFNALTADPDRTRLLDGGAVVDLLNDDKKKIDFRNTLVSVHDKAIIVAFDTDWGATTSSPQSMVSNDVIFKPDKCLFDACICLYTDKIDRNDIDKNVYACKSFEGNVKFAAVYDTEGDNKRSCGKVRQDFNLGIPGLTYSYAIFYGDYKGCSMGTAWTYVEKYTDGDTTYILITPETPNKAEIDARKNKIEAMP